MSAADLSAPAAGSPGARVRAVHDRFHGDLLEVSMGPHHPSTHGVFRMIVTLDGNSERAFGTLVSAIRLVEHGNDTTNLQ